MACKIIHLLIYNARRLVKYDIGKDICFMTLKGYYLVSDIVTFLPPCAEAERETTIFSQRRQVKLRLTEPC